MELLPCFLIVILANISCGTNITLESDKVIKVLNDICSSRLKKELTTAINTSLEYLGKLDSVATTCQQSLKVSKGKCCMCVKEQCWQRALQKDCQQSDDFNNSFANGIYQINEKIELFYANIMSYFLHEDLKGIFHQDILYFFFNNSFSNTMLKNIPKPHGSKFARIIKKREDQSAFDRNDNVDYAKAGFIEDGLAAVSKYMQEFVRKFLKKYASEHAKDKAKNFFTQTLPNAVEKTNEAIKTFFQGIFNTRRRRRSLTRKQSPCEEFLGDDRVQHTCSQYLQNCSECLIDKSQFIKICPDLSKIKDEMQKNIWIIPAMLSDGPQFQILNISHSPVNETSVKTKVTLFINGGITGIELLTLDNGKTTETMADVIFDQALVWFKKHWERKEDILATENYSYDLEN